LDRGGAGGGAGGDRVRARGGGERDLGVEWAEKERLLAESDFVTLHVPLTEETRHLIGAAELEQMKCTACLLNVSRGPVVDEAALAVALTRGQIAGAALDVFEREPEVEAALLERRNVVLAPHLASGTVETRTLMAVMAAENVVAALGGRRPPHLVNPEVWEKFVASS